MTLAMADFPNQTIETSLGTITLAHFDSGDALLRWPPNPALSQAAKRLFAGRAAWKPNYRGWIIPARYCSAILAERARL